jgi:hypothetical protein
MRSIPTHLLGSIVGIALAMPAAACLSEDGPATSTDELALSGDGPFATTKALIDYWTNTPTSGALAQIYLNGRKVYERSGFGPAFVKQYFTCGPSNILATCTTGFFDGYGSFNTLVSRSPAHTEIRKDFVVVRAGTDGTSEDVTTCSGDPSFYGTVKYFKVTAYNNGFIPYASSCYP